MKRLTQIVILAVLATGALAQAPDNALTVRPAPAAGPQMTDYLLYQLDMAWRQDDLRRARFAAIRNETDLLQVQRELRGKLLAMIGGLPSERTPLNAQITGRIQMEGFHIEKVLFESVPGFHVTALLYVPDDGLKTHPAVLFACGHSTNGKDFINYQTISQRLVKRGYVVLNWDPVGQGERSQFFDAAKGGSRYNLVCGEHAVLGNLAYLAGANLARWEIWDGMRALDYLLTRPEVDGRRISLTGTSGGGTQTALLGALDQRIGVVIPSCYISSLPMRMANRIFKDPDSEPEQDLAGMISNGVDHPGLLMLIYPRPLFLATAVEDFFPIEGARKTFREISDVYRRFGLRDRVGMAEGIHRHMFSDQNQEAAFAFLDRFNGMAPRTGLAAVKKLDDKQLQVTQTGQVLLDHKDARNLLDLVREYYEQNKDKRSIKLADLYYGDGYPGINRWNVVWWKNRPEATEIAWQEAGSAQVDDVKIEKYLLHHSERLAIPVVVMRQAGAKNADKVLLSFSSQGKVTAADLPEVRKRLNDGYTVVSFDPRGTGETRMNYRTFEDAQVPFEKAYVDPLNSVMANYVYNTLLTGRPLFLQWIEDGEIVSRFARRKLNAHSIAVAATGEAFTVAAAMSEVLPEVTLAHPGGAQAIAWSELVEQKREQWPIELLLPNGAYVH